MARKSKRRSRGLIARKSKGRSRGLKHPRVKEIVRRAFEQLVYAEPKPDVSCRKLRVDNNLKKSISRAAVEIARQRGLVLMQSGDAHALAEADTLNDLAATFQLGGTVADASASLLSAMAAGAYPADAAAHDVANVIGAFKHINPNNVAASDKLDRWHFQPTEKRAIAQSINLYYYNALGLVMNYLIHPRETKNAVFVADLIRVVLQHNPHRPARTG
jgi:hypothetical protein